jgi:tRNA(Ile)-lysidine synthase
MESLTQLESRILQSIELSLKNHELEHKLLPDHNYMVALSGGADSMFLVHALVRLLGTARLSCLYVDHQLSAESSKWLDVCKSTSKHLGIKLYSERINLGINPNRNLESRARLLRYKAIESHISIGHTAVTGHHLDDQFETILMRLMKGTSFKGLAGIHRCRSLGEGFLLRPMLNVKKNEIIRILSAWNVDYIQDESNSANKFDRNYIRNNIIPIMLDRFPKGNEKLVASICSLENELQGLSEFTETYIQDLTNKGSISLDDLRNIPQKLHDLVVRKLIYSLCNKHPSKQDAYQILKGVNEGDKKSTELFKLSGYTFWQHSRKIYFVKNNLLGSEGTFGDISFSLMESKESVLPREWVDSNQIKIKVGRFGDKIIPWQGKYQKSVKDVLYEKRVFPWLRPHVPLIYFQDQLISIANLCVSDRAKHKIIESKNYIINWNVPSDYQLIG